MHGNEVCYLCIITFTVTGLKTVCGPYYNRCTCTIIVSGDLCFLFCSGLASLSFEQIGATVHHWKSMCSSG